ncbi:LIC_10190 family membrane protein [Hyunsoonleella sp. 2307UL5-6]|uniref:LIC_10190 family membrane protein n=1 Tax=Hyunsoonleella sp. 2307UL5-6 TaxID=3384768 RepID=UPI0039BCC178
MLFIVLSWIYITITCLNFGFVFRKFLNIKDCHFSIHQVLGLFLYTLITTTTAFFIRINIEYYISILILNCVLTFIFRIQIITYFIDVYNTLKTFNKKLKVLYVLLFIIVLTQSATKPYLIDNESYYIQTIKWINEFGYVKGLANLHLFLGQNSSWHTLQAGFNFPFIANIFNDINGFIYITLGFLFVEKLSNASHKQDFFIGLILVFSLFFMQFVNAPSPDLIIFLMAPYIVYEYLVNGDNMSASKFNILFSSVLFLCFVKVTTIVFALLILILFIKNFKILKENITRYIILSTSVLGLFLLKNLIISGHLFYPTAAFDLLSIDWKLPPELLQLYKTGTYQSGMNDSDVSQFSFFEKLKYWLQIPKLDGVFNKLFLLLLIIFPFFILKSKAKKPLLLIYLLAVLQFTLAWLNSPQYRFFIVFIIIISLQIFIRIFKSRRIGTILIYTSLVLSAIPILVPLNLKNFTSNKYLILTSNFKFKNILIPEESTKTATTFSKENIDGFKYNSPDIDVFFWGTGNGDLPCVNKQQVDYIKDYYYYTPQLRGNNLKDGFISKPSKTK